MSNWEWIEHVFLVFTCRLSSSGAGARETDCTSRFSFSHEIMAAARRWWRRCLAAVAIWSTTLLVFSMAITITLMSQVFRTIIHGQFQRCCKLPRHRISGPSAEPALTTRPGSALMSALLPLLRDPSPGAFCPSNWRTVPPSFDSLKIIHFSSLLRAYMTHL